MTNSNERLAALNAISLEYGAQNDAEGAVCIEVMQDPSVDPEIRAEATQRLSPGLELGDEVFDWENESEVEDSYFSKQMFDRAVAALEAAWRDTSLPTILRRRALEASLPVHSDWQNAAIREALDSDDIDWNVTGVYASAYRPGFDDDVRGALEAPKDERVLFEAVGAAAALELTDAAPKIEEIALNSEQRYELDTQLGAIEALALVRREKSTVVLEQLTQSKNDDIAETAQWALDEGSRVAQFFDKLFGQ